MYNSQQNSANLISAMCPYCNATYRTDSFNKVSTCKSCGKTFFTAKAVEKYNSAYSQTAPQVDIVPTQNIQPAYQTAPPPVQSFNQFSHLPEPQNNGAVQVMSTVCPHCRQNIQVDASNDAAVCPSCGTPFAINRITINQTNQSSEVNIRLPNPLKPLFDFFEEHLFLLQDFRFQNLILLLQFLQYFWQLHLHY